MQELLLSTGNKSAYYPDSGPGPKKLLNGSPALGYFGPVTASELFTPIEMTLFANFTVGSSIIGITNLVWLKFFWEERIIYIPKRVLSLAVPWEHVYSKGLVYGVKGPGTYPSPVGSPVNQYRLIVKEEGTKNWAFKVRLPSFYPTDPVAAFSSSALGEFYSLLSRVVASPQGTGEWESFPSGEIDGAVYSSGQQSGTTTTNNCISYYSTASPQIPKTQTTSNNWRPVLELVDLNLETLPVARPIGDYNGLRLPRPILTVDNTNLIRTVKQIRYATTKLQVPIATVSYFEKLSPIRIRNWATSMLKAPVVSLTKV